MGSPNVVLFDLDDTLYPERDYVFGGFRTVAEYLSTICGFETDDILSRLISLFETGIRGNTFDLILQNLGLSSHIDLVQELIERYRTHTPRIKPYPEVARVLETLRLEFGLGLLTDGYASVQRRKVKALNIGHFFVSVLYSDDFGRKNWKPSLIPFKRLLVDLETEPSHAVYVGDNPHKDFIGARKMGITTIRTLRPNTEYYEISLQPEFEADYEIQALTGLPLLIKKIFSIEKIEKSR